MHECTNLVSWLATVSETIEFWILEEKINWLYLLSYLYSDFPQVNKMATYDLAMQEFEASKAMSLAETSWNIRTPAPEKAFEAPYALFRSTAYC